MIALYILLGLTLLLLLLLVIPVRVAVTFEEEFAVTISYLFIKKPLDFSEETEPTEQKEKPKSTSEDTALDKLKRILKRKGFWGFLQSLYELIKLTLKAGGRIVKKTTLSHFDLYLCLSGADDPCEAAQTYGKLCAGVYPACAELFAMTGAPRRKKPKKTVSVDLNYELPENTVRFSARLSVKPITILHEGLRLLLNARLTLTDLLRAAKAPQKSQNPLMRKENLHE